MPRRFAALRIVDATQRLWRAPEAHFDAHEIGLDAFAWNIENRHLIAALEARAAEMPNLHLIRNDAAAVDSHIDGVVIRTVGGDTIDARLAVGADGKNSLCRTAAGIAVQSRSYPQIALTYSVTHSRPHRNISTEFHTEQGPFTTVPLPGDRSSIVCVVNEAVARDLQSLDARSARSRTGAPLAFDPRQDQSRCRPRRISAGDGNRAALCGGADRADRRSRAPLSADRRAGPQSRPARCRGDRRNRMPSIATIRVRRT